MLKICTAGVDEVGRGALVGPVIAAAVILNPDASIDGLADSKTLSRSRRETLCGALKEKALVWALGRAEASEIDALNILKASLLAMRRAVLALEITPHLVLIDGNRLPALAIPARAIVGGDAKISAISAASIIAKVTRDEEMIDLDVRYPQYGFARHKGYPTRAHLDALCKYGITPLHRRSFSPVKKIIAEGENNEVNKDLRALLCRK